ncbi:unnamed protein product, partial [Staurois parvus]
GSPGIRSFCLDQRALRHLARQWAPGHQDWIVWLDSGHRVTRYDSGHWVTRHQVIWLASGHRVIWQGSGHRVTRYRIVWINSGYRVKSGLIGSSGWISSSG